MEWLPVRGEQCKIAQQRNLNYDHRIKMSANRAHNLEFVCVCVSHRNALSHK